MFTKKPKHMAKVHSAVWWVQKNNIQLRACPGLDEILHGHVPDDRLAPAPASIKGLNQHSRPLSVRFHKIDRGRAPAHGLHAHGTASCVQVGEDSAIYGRTDDIKDSLPDLGACCAQYPVLALRTQALSGDPAPLKAAAGHSH